MRTQYQHKLFLALSLTGCLSAVASVDYDAAQQLKKKMSGTVDNITISPIWKPDESALFYQSDNTIVELSTETGEKKQAVDPAELTRFFNGEKPEIPIFTVSDNGDFICMATTGKQIRTVCISEHRTALVEIQDNPFALTPRKTTPQTCSSKGNGPTKLYFVNDTDQTVDLAWIDPSKVRKKYKALQPGEVRAQSTHAGHVFNAGGLAFTATKRPGIAFLSARPETPEKPRKNNAEKGAAQKWTAEIKDHNLFVTNKDSGVETQLTTNGTKTNSYCGPFSWSPDGRHLIASKELVGTRRTIDLIQAAPDDQLQPKTKTISYLKPGDDIDVKKPHLFDLQAGKEIPLDDALFSNPWKISGAHWSATGDRFFFLLNERGHQTLRLLALQASSGKIATVVEETSKTFIDYAFKTFVHHLEQTDEMIWMSERSGWNHLYLVNRQTGQIQPISSGNWVVRGVEHVDEEKRQIWFKVMGCYPNQDPYYFHYARVNFDGTGLVLLTESNGTHSVNFSKDRKFFTDTWSRADLPPVHELRRSSDGKKVTDLGKADASRLWKIHPHRPEPFTTKGRDGKTDIYGVIYRPSHLDPNKKYPVIESIYAGPHDFFTQKVFKAYSRHHYLAELGFIVVQIDGMGTNWRSRKFHDVCWKNIKDAGFPDRIAWIKAAATKYPYIDLSRVGIHGGSAGGQNALRAVLDHADFYKAAVADCGCHDNRMDKIWWNEAWMGWPVDESYEKSSNVVDAHKLGGKLLLTVGMLDSNVDPSSTMQVVDALIKANKDFELYADPNGGHCVTDTKYGKRKLSNFFVKHLIEASE